jgi:hypothetical protein
MKSVLHEFKVHRVPAHLLDLKTDCYFGESLPWYMGKRDDTSVPGFGVFFCFGMETIARGRC